MIVEQLFKAVSARAIPGVVVAITFCGMRLAQTHARAITEVDWPTIGVYGLLMIVGISVVEMLVLSWSGQEPGGGIAPVLLGMDCALAHYYPAGYLSLTREHVSATALASGVVAGAVYFVLMPRIEGKMSPTPA